MLQGLVDHLVKPNTVHEQTTVNSVNQVDRHVLLCQLVPVDSVTDQRSSVRGLEDDPRDVKVLSVTKSFINQSFNYFGLEHVASMFHINDFFNFQLRFLVSPVVFLSQTLASLLLEKGHGTSTRQAFISNMVFAYS